MSELWQKTATELGAIIHNKEASSREVVQAHLDRIERVNPKLNAITVVLAETALDAAEQADRSESADPLHGVPFTIKENIDCVGSATTNGVPAWAEAMPSLDAPIVDRLKNAGAIPLARTNLPELGLRITTDNPLRGRTLNPWDESRTAGGSSGGEASALASGMSPLGLGNDIGGSVRNPAFCCGITSLKPTAGRIPRASSIAPTEMGLAGQLMAVEGPMARSVADVRLAYETISGRHSRDPVSVDAPLYGPEMPKRAAVATSVPGVDLPNSVTSAVSAASRALEDAGYQVEEINPPALERVHEVWGHILTMEFKPQLTEFAKVMSEGPLELLRFLCERFDPAKVEIPAIHAERNGLQSQWSEFFADYPIMIGPTWTNIQFEHDADLDGKAGLDMTVDRLRFIAPANVLGLPSAAVPIDVIDGLPTGVQVYADQWRDDLALQGAQAIENEIGTICPIDPKF